jgi:vacuolar-type H+-ATPase subunit I/STV1
MEYFEKDYKITGTYASLLSFIGWLILLGGIVSLGIAIYTSSTGTLPQFMYTIGIDYLVIGEILIGGIGGIAMGLLVIITGQILRAIVDNTNANKEALWVLKSIKNLPIMNKQEEANKAKGKYERDGIKFNSKKDLEAYFESQNSKK